MPHKIVHAHIILLLVILYLLPVKAGYTPASTWQHLVFMFFHGNIFHLIGNCYCAYYILNNRTFNWHTTPRHHLHYSRPLLVCLLLTSPHRRILRSPIRHAGNKLLLLLPPEKLPAPPPLRHGMLVIHTTPQHPATHPLFYTRLPIHLEQQLHQKNSP